ncbi:ABC transporter ATP-binding protein [Microtetraspora fusca]|uniref:ABC transporter ATP-binding protein n=1 Tax=Microtetraspora fusca TaxID=1997 RepID=UPI00082B8C30|nr:ABC transporter ATP-binding protein [Microtetraspora fusca]
MSHLLDVEDLVLHHRVPRTIADRVARRPARVVRAVDGVSLHVDRGELVALVGESGSGKSSTAQSILGLVTPSHGTVRIDGSAIEGLGARAMRPWRRRMQMVLQDPYGSLDPRCTVASIVEEPLLIHRLGGSAEQRRAKAVDALERAGLRPAETFLPRRPRELSGGQRQRVAIAAGLVLGPSLLIADEPASMLDVSVRAGVLGLLRELCDSGETGILLITHDLATVAHYADRLAVMYLGRIVEEGPTRTVLEAPAHPYTRALMSSVLHPDPRERGGRVVLGGDVPDPGARPDGCAFHPRCPLADDGCHTTDPALGPVDQRPAGHSAACLRPLPAGHTTTAPAGRTTTPDLAGRAETPDPVLWPDRRNHMPGGTAGTLPPADPGAVPDPLPGGTVMP